MNNLKVLIRPQYSGEDMGDGGIRRVVEAQTRYLPEYGVQPISENDKAQAEVCAIHAAEDPLPDPKIPVVAHNHGLYWTAEQDWDDWAWHVNRKCIENIRHASYITAPSRWVANSIARGMMRQAAVVPHGITLEDWQPSKEQRGYVLWNKARVDVVSDPQAVKNLAELLPQRQFLTTFGESSHNIRVIGNRIPYADMIEMVRHAGVLLATVRETFGIGTLEAMACGVPVVGWAYGGQMDVIEHGVDGWLAPFGDYDSLVEGVKWALANRNRIGEAAREKIVKHYQWRDVVKLYAKLYHAALTPEPPVKTTVIVTCYNLAQYLPDTLFSVLAQTDKNIECIVVDDASTDNSRQIAEQFCREHPERFRLITHEKNKGLVAARNTGIENSRGKYFIFIDADDMLAPNAVEVLAYWLDTRRDLTVAYGHLDIVKHDGSERVRNPWPYPEYNHERQLMHLNNLPYSSLIRKSHWLEAGGYRLRADRNEDAEMWCRLGSYGWKLEKVTQDSTLIYRDRGDSKSKQEAKKYGGEPDWTFWNTWKDWPQLMPYGSISKPPKKLISWPVRSYDQPQVSVIVPVGPGHERFLQDSLDSLLAQTFVGWECVVVNDTGKDLAPYLKGFPFVQLHSTKGKQGAGAARNLGVKHSSAPLLFFLDADDILFPDCLRKHVVAWNEAVKQKWPPTVIYSDWVSIKGNDEFEPVKAFDWDCWKLMQGAADGATMLISFLHSRRMYDAIGGFDESILWEDWDYHIKLVTTGGVCGWRLPEPLLFYRMTTGTRRDYASENRQELLQIIYERYKPYYRRETMCGCSAGGAKAQVSAMNKNGNGNNPPVQEGDLVLISYSGPMGEMLIQGRQTGIKYGRRGGGDQFYVHQKDADGDPRFTRVPAYTPEPEVKIELLVPA